MSSPTEFKGSDRLDSLDAKGSRLFLHPAEVRGVFRKYRQLVYFILVIIFLTLPWLRINGHQAILLDIPQRRFAILGLTFWAHDGPMIFFVLGILTLSLAFVTAIWGRVWCGWGCPQTVFIDSVFRRIERWIEGDYIVRRRIAQSPMTAITFAKKLGKWTLFVVISLIISHSFMAYFVGTGELAQMIRQSPRENWTTFLIMSFITAVIAFDFGWFREQFCLIMCPYGRFQSVLMDENSLAVLYDEQRGEPRRGSVAKGQATGDCVSCNKCVNVCPTGIDIRNGVQMECIACTACIDACAEVMDKLHKPRGLIRYDSIAGISGSPRRVWRPRTLVYMSLILTAIMALGIAVANHQEIDITVLRAIGAPYQEIKLASGETEIINHFKLHLKNLSFARAGITPKLPAELQTRGYAIASPTSTFTVDGGKEDSPHIFVRFPKGDTQPGGQKDVSLDFVIELSDASPADGESKDPTRRSLIIKKGVRLIGPL